MFQGGGRTVYLCVDQSVVVNVEEAPKSVHGFVISAFFGSLGATAGVGSFINPYIKAAVF